MISLLQINLQELILAYNKVIPAGVTIVTSDNKTVGTGKVTLKVTNPKDTNIVGEFSTSFNVVNATVTKADVAVAAGTKDWHNYFC